MKIIQRTKYLVYYLRELDWNQFNRFMKFACNQTGKSKFALWIDAILSVYKYNIGLADYFIFKFYEKSHAERDTWVGTGFKYEFDLIMNPIESRKILQDKKEFNKVYKSFLLHHDCDIKMVSPESEIVNSIFGSDSGKIVLKNSLGQCGKEVEIRSSTEIPVEQLQEYMAVNNFDILETYIDQHDDLKRLSPSGLNTIRVITMVNKDKSVDILGVRLRISVNSPVDNLASGNIACFVNKETGIVEGNGFYSDITKESVSIHPITNEKLIGFQIPMFDMVKKKAIELALFKPENRCVGWDIAVTNSGVDVLEGNHNWCKILWQIPVDKGLKSELLKYLG